MIDPKEEFDVLVVGGGCAGLTTADVLSELGAKVLLIEQGDKLAPGPSTRNGGYVHGGGFHAAVIDDPVRAARTAIRCRDGLEYYKTHHWTAIYHDAMPVRLLVRQKELADRAVERWESYSIKARPLSDSQKAGSEFEFVGETALAAYVDDLPINYSLVYQKLLTKIRQRGGMVACGHRLTSYDGGVAKIATAETSLDIRAKQVVYCSGYGTKELLAQKRSQGPFLQGISVKLWKSHVVLTKRFTKHGYMIVDPGEVSVMPQGDYCVVCQSQEDAEIDSANYDQVPETVQGIKRRLQETYNVPEDAKYGSNACLKPSVHFSDDGARSVDIHVFELSSSEILALPGKATEAPLMAAEVAAKLQGLLTRSITDRPGEAEKW